MKLSPKQFAMKFMNAQLDPSKLNIEKADIEALNPGQEISDKVFEDVQARIRDEISKLKPKFATYVAKYCSGETPSKELPTEGQVETPASASSEPDADTQAPATSVAAA